MLQHQRVALVEAMDLTSTLNWTPQKDNYSNRTVSLTPGSMQFLDSKCYENIQHKNENSMFININNFH